MASFSVVSNISAANAQANLINTNAGLQKAITRLSSGFRINQAGDDAAGLQLANTYRSTQAVLNQGIRNANDALSTLQIKDGALNNIGTLLDRLSTLAAQSASASNTLDRTALNTEFADVRTEITREVAVAGLGASAGFSAFISNETVPRTARSAAPSRRRTRRRSASPPIDHRDGGRRADGGCGHRGGGHQARHGAELGRHPREPSDVRHQPGATRRWSATRRRRAGFATPTWRRNRRT